VNETSVIELDVDRIRAQFPALARPASGGGATVYFDGPGGTQVPQRVIDAMTTYLATSNANADGPFATSIETDACIARARVAAGLFVNGDPDGIAFGANMTTLNFSLSRAVGRTLRPGDEIVTTVLDHDANVSPWLLLAQDRDLVVRKVGVNADLELDLDGLRANLNDRTKVVAVTLASNAVGSLTPAAQIADMAHSVGALAWVDAVAFTAHRRTDVRALGCDVLVCSPYKFFGPHAGVAWLRPDLAATLPADRVRPAAQTPPGHRFETGTQSHEALAGLTAAVEYIASLGSEGSVSVASTARDAAGREAFSAALDSAYRAIAARETALSESFVAGLDSLPGVRIAGVPGADPLRRVGVFGLILAERKPSEVAGALADDGVNTWFGNFYAQEIVDHLGLSADEGLLRIGLYHYNTDAEVDHCLASLKRILAS
jgi:cysteine desulfurase family protein (TIGR01976 family)